VEHSVFSVDQGVCSVSCIHLAEGETGASVSPCVLREAHLSFLIDAQQYQTRWGVAKQTLLKAGRMGNFYLGPMMILPVAMFPWIRKNRNVRFWFLSLGAVWFGLFVIVPFQVRYAAPVCGVFYALGVYSLRRLWILKRWGNPAGRVLTPGIVVLSVLMQIWNYPPVDHRPRIQAQLEATGRDHLVLVRCGDHHFLAEEWVYNRATLTVRESFALAIWVLRSTSSCSNITHTVWSGALKRITILQN
jgi:hypothetical protein